MCAACALGVPGEGQGFSDTMVQGDDEALTAKLDRGREGKGNDGRSQVTWIRKSKTKTRLGKHYRYYSDTYSVIDNQSETLGDGY